MRSLSYDHASNTGWYFDLNTDPGEAYWDSIVPDHPTGAIWNGPYSPYSKPNPDGNSALSSLSQYIPGDVSSLFTGLVTGDVRDALLGDDILPPNAGNNQAPNSPQLLDYLDAPYAEHYGMSAETAYQEALANTAYQRKVADLKAAGLNPVLGINGAGAASFSGSLPSYGSSGSGKSTSDLSGLLGKLSYGLPTFVNGLVNLAVTLKTGNGMSGFGAGMMAQNITQGALNLGKNFT